MSSLTVSVVLAQVLQAVSLETASHMHAKDRETELCYVAHGNQFRGWFSSGLVTPVFRTIALSLGF